MPLPDICKKLGRQQTEAGESLLKGFDTGTPHSMHLKRTCFSSLQDDGGERFREGTPLKLRQGDHTGDLTCSVAESLTVTWKGNGCVERKSLGRSSRSRLEVAPQRMGSAYRLGLM